MRRTLETKTRYADLARARQLLDAGGGVRRGEGPQQDTYFRVPEGWLKLREQGTSAELVAYLRTASSASHAATYAVTTVREPNACKDGLEAVLGIRAIVRKRREVWTVNATTVHLDDVEGLGRFIELETPIDVASGQAHWECAALLEIDPHTDLALSYADLLDGL